MARLFVALDLPDSYQQAMAALCHSLDSRFGRDLPRIRWTRPGNWHLTLKFLGETDEDRLPAIRDALSAIDFTPFALQAGGGGFFPTPAPGRTPRPRVVWVGLVQGGKQAATLAAQVDESTARLGFPRERRPFSPHLTLGRVKDGPRQGKTQGGTAWAEVMAKVNRSEWPQLEMREFLLYRSVLGPDGPRYSVVERFSGIGLQGGILPSPPSGLQKP